MRTRVDPGAYRRLSRATVALGSLLMLCAVTLLFWLSAGDSMSDDATMTGVAVVCVLAVLFALLSLADMWLYKRHVIAEIEVLRAHLPGLSMPWDKT